MKWRTIIWRGMRLQGISTAVFLMLAILCLTLTGTEGTRRSIKNLQSMKNVDSKAPITEVSRGSSSTEDSSPALNSFLNNVLRAQDELKWIDQAVHRVDTKETQENVRNSRRPNRYLRSPVHRASRRHRSNIRSKRKSKDEESYWPSSKRSYYDVDNENPGRVYLDDEMQVNRYANPSRNFDDDERYRGSRRKQERSSLVDDSTLNHWAQKEGLDVPGGWLDPDRWSEDQSSDESDRNVDDLLENPRDERDARVDPSVGLIQKKETEESTLESLKKTVLELRKSLEDSDKKMGALTEGQGVVKNRERNVEEKSGGKEDRTKGENEKVVPFESDAKSTKSEYSSGSNWWDDPRSAADIFDFKRRDEDAMDDEDDDEDSEPGISEFDYMMQRVKRDGDDEEESKARVYRRAGFGGSYPEDHEEGSRAARVYRAIREAGRDDNNEGNSNDVESEEVRKRDDINSNENGHSVSEAKEIKKLIGSGHEEKNVADDNPSGSSGVVEKIPESVAARDSNKNLYDTKDVAGDETRSSSPKDEKKEPEEGLPPEESPENSIKSRLNELLKTAPKEPLAETNPQQKKVGEKDIRNVDSEGKSTEVEKSESNDDNDAHKLSKESEVEKKRGDLVNLKGKKASASNENPVKDSEAKSEDKGTKNTDDSKVAAASPPRIGGSGEELKAPEDSKVGENSKIVKLDEVGKLKEVKNSEIQGLNSGHKDSKSSDVKNEAASASEDNGVKLSRERLSDDERKYNKQEESYGEDKRLMVYSDKDNAKFHERGDNDAAELAKDERRQDSDFLVRDKKSDESGWQELPSNLKDQILKRKLLWLSEKSTANGGSKIVEIRDGSRDSAWDQNHGQKSGQRPANFLKGPSAVKGLEKESKFARRSLMVAKNDEALHRLKKRKGIRSRVSDRSNGEPGGESGRVEERSLDKSEAPQSYSMKRSPEQKLDRQRESEVADEAYELEDDDVAQDEDDFRDSGVKIEGDENLQADQDGDRDPIRDRINMLIKQKLDDRGKGKLIHMKREANSIQYYDYDSAANSGDPDADSTVVIYDQQQTFGDNATYPQVAIDRAPPEVILKKNEQEEAEMKIKLKQEQLKNKEPKQEFISDVELSKAQTRKPPSNKITEDQSGRNTVQREDEPARSNDRWLGQPEEADLEAEQDSKDSNDGRYDEIRESGEAEKPDNENGEVFGEPLEYSVNVHGKLDPESIGGILNEKGIYEKDKEIGENENRNEKPQVGIDDDWKYEGIRDSPRSQGDQEVERDLEPADRRLSNRNWQYRGDSARIEEENKGRKFYSNNGDDKEDVRSSREAREAEDFDQDSLPTMLDRSSGPREPAPGERTYLVIAPNEVKYPEKERVENSSSSPGNNYLALKVTDDMFKGGIEQSNPADDKMGETNSMERTTTEWKAEGEGNSNYKYDEAPSRQNIEINPRDVAHESFVDPEEMLGDFDDDAMPRFRRDLKYVQESGNRNLGRILLSVSYPTDPFEVVDSKMNWNGDEKPLEKYLENAQSHFQKSEMTGAHRIKKRNTATGENPIDKVNEVDRTSSGMTIDSLEDKNSTGIAATMGDAAEKTHGDNDNYNHNVIDKDKRGSTNVEEWEMDTPSVQKQHLEEYAKKNADFERGSSHEREIRSVKTENFKSESDQGSRKLPSANINRSKIVQKLKSRDKFLPSSSRADPFANYVPSWDSSPRDNYRVLNAKKGVSHHDWKKLGPPESRYWRANREHRKSAHRNRSNNRHYRHKGMKKHSNKISGTRKTATHETRESEGRSKNVKRHRNPVMRHVKTMSNPVGKKSFQVAIEEKKAMDENADKPTDRPEHDEGQKKKFTVLLAADNMEDESQMDLALHGELAGKIVERIFDQVQKNDALKASLGPGLFRKHKSEDAVSTDKIYREGLDEDEVKHTEGMMRRVMELLGRLILDEVQRKTCASLPPDMREFLQWILGVDRDNRPMEQEPQPSDSNRDLNHLPDDHFLFEDPTMNNEIADLGELNKKVKVLRNLIDQYSSLSTKEKTKVRGVHDYLNRQLELLAKYIEAKEAQGAKTQTEASTSTRNISQYQNNVPNSTETTVYQSTMSPLVGTPSILMLSNASFIEHPAEGPPSHLYRSGNRDTRSSKGDEAVNKRRKKRKHKKHKHPHSKKHKHKHEKHKHNKNKGKKKKKHHKREGAQSPEYRKLIRRAAMLRKKRANYLNEDDWDPVDSGYEEPTIYTSAGKLTNKRRRSVASKGSEKPEDGMMNSPYSWQDALSGNLNSDVPVGLVKNTETIEDLNLDGRIPAGAQDPEEERDVLGASVALQSWLNPTQDDLGSSDDFKEDVERDAAQSGGPHLSDDEVTLLSKREAWKSDNEQQLEEVAFGKDMRGKWKEKEEFEKLTEMDRKKNPDDGATRKKREEDDKKRDTDDANVSHPEESDGRKEDEIVETVKEVEDKITNDEDKTMKINDNVKTLNENLKNGIPESLEDLKQASPGSLTKGDIEKVEDLKSISSEALNVDRKSFEKEEKFENREKKRSPGVITPEVDGSAILPLLEVSELRQQQKEAAKTEKDDQRDIADQMLGFESPLITGLNTY